MNAQDNDNRQLSLNIMHWLSGLIPVDRRRHQEGSFTAVVVQPSQER